MGGTRESYRWLARGGIMSFAGAVVGAIAGFALTVVLTRVLGRDGAGVVLQATGIFAVVLALAKVSMDTAAIFLLPRVRHDDPARVRSTVTLVLVSALCVSTLATVVMQFAAPLVWAGSSPALVDTVRALSWFLPVNALMVVMTACVRALGGIKEYVLGQNLFLPILRLFLVWIVAVSTQTVVAVGVAWAFPLLVLTGIMWWVLRRRLLDYAEVGQGSRWPSREAIGQIWRFALPRTVATGLDQALVWLDIILVGMLAGDGAAGVYGSASRFLQAGIVVDSALRVVVSPRLSALVNEGKTQELSRLHSTATKWLILFATPALVIMAIFAPTLMRILGKGFEDGAAVVVVLAIGACVTFAAGNIHTLLIMGGHSGWAAFNKVVVLSLNVVGNLFLIPRMGVVGAALSWAVCMFVDALLASVEVRFCLGVSMTPRVLIIPVGIVTATVVAPSLLIHLLLGQGFLALTVATALSVALFLCACWLLRTRIDLTGLRREKKRRAQQ